MLVVRYSYALALQVVRRQMKSISHFDAIYAEGAEALRRSGSRRKVEMWPEGGAWSCLHVFGPLLVLWRFEV